MDFQASKQTMQRTAYAAVGAPFVVGRKLKDFGTKMVEDAQTQYDRYAVEGEKLAKQLRDRNVVEEIEHRMHIDKVQDRVEQLRDQLENTLNNWRESFAPEEEAQKPATKKPTAKTTSAKAAPEAKKPAAKKPAAKAASAAKATPEAKKPAAKAGASK